MKEYKKPELADDNSSKFVTASVAALAGVLFGAWATQKVLGNDITGSLKFTPCIESVLAYE